MAVDPGLEWHYDMDRYGVDEIVFHCIRLMRREAMVEEHHAAKCLEHNLACASKRSVFKYTLSPSLDTPSS